MSEKIIQSDEQDAFSSLRNINAISEKNNEKTFSEDEVTIIKKIAEKNGFTRRESRAKKRIYTEQFNVRCREGMNDLIDDIVYVLKVQKQQMLESAILCFLEKQGLNNLIEKYRLIIDE